MRKQHSNGARQHVTEGGTVYVQGHKMTARNVRVERHDGLPRVSFDGIAEDGDSLKGTHYDGGTYGGNFLIYTFDGRLSGGSPFTP